SVAYHLAKLGWTDVVLLEQGRLSSGTTWHAAGLVGQLRTHPSMTRLIRYSTELYSKLEAETGLSTGWKQCGSLTVARTPERRTLLRRVAAMAEGQGVACDVLDARQAGEKWPIMRTDDLVGAAWLPGDGKANPADITQALAKGARQGGVRIFEKTRVDALKTRGGRIAGVVTDRGEIASDVVVCCSGQWSRALARQVGVAVPLYSCEHMYIVTKRIEGVFPELPCLRDPDGYIYFKEEVGGLLMGGFEPVAKPWHQAHDIPKEFEFQLLPDDWDQFAILMENALIRVPALEKAEVRQFVNGPESFTADNNYILGEAPGVPGFFVGAGFNSMGIASAGGAGKALAEWIVAGEPTMDLWPVDIRRFAPFNGNDAWLKDRVAEVLGLHYKLPWPNRELETARPLRRSPLYDRLKGKNAVFGSKMGWERANAFAPAGAEPKLDYSWGRANWLAWSAAEHRAAREAVAVFDQTSFSKFLLEGRDAEAVLQRLCANDMAVPPGRMVYTGMLNARGGYETDLTCTRLAADRYLIVTGTAQTVRDADWIRRNIPADARAVLTDVGSAYAVLSVMGPRSRDLLARLSAADFSNAAFPFATMRPVDLGYARVLAGRITYVGELGWELYVPTEFAVAVYEALAAAGGDLGLRDAGYYALESLRLEKGYRAWGREISPDVTPWEAGLGFAVKLDKAAPFIGREALAAAKAKPPARRIVSFALDDPEPIAWGGELVVRDGRPAGEVTSAAYGHALGRTVCLAMVHAGGAAADAAWLASGTWQIDIAGKRYAATVHTRAPYDPAGERVRG
ncbi:MAG: FAD-dependent oxidoreductase, partial [Candidatus Odyssella sp.]|nr:FAD-dependent oxidoreductase [Candidatus Odyssella sp.]